MIIMFDFILWTDPAVQAALCQALGAIIASVIAAICATVIGKKILNRERLQDALKMAASDIEFLLAVENHHCQHHLDTGATSHRRRKRALAIQDGHTWSGRFTPGRNASNKLLH